MQLCPIWASSRKCACRQGLGSGHPLLRQRSWTQTPSSQDWTRPPGWTINTCACVTLGDGYPRGWRTLGPLDSRGNGALRWDQPALGGTYFPHQTAPSNEARASRHVITHRDAHTIACGEVRSRHNRLCYRKTGNTKTQPHSADTRTTHRCTPFRRALSYESLEHNHAMPHDKASTHAPPHSPQHTRKAADTSTDASDLTPQIIVPENRNTCSPLSRPPAVAGVD